MELKEMLIEKCGYNSKNVGFILNKLDSLTGVFQEALQQWVTTGSVKDAGEYHGYTIKRLMDENKMNFPAALTTLKWIADEGEKAVEKMKQGVK